MAREQRRLAAILAADVVGYSRLMGRDESGTLARLREHRTQRFEPALARNGGRLVKLTGDGALAEFGSAVDALSAAIEFQQAMVEANRDQPEDTRIVFRIGIHLGDLIVDGDDLYGDGVNVAARLEAEAPPAGIVVSRAVREAVLGRLSASFHPLGELALKNIDRPIRAFVVKWSADDWRPSADVTLRSTKEAVSGADHLSVPHRPSIAVLPFQNMSGDPEQGYFADGISEDIVTGLSRTKSLFVIASNSTFAYKGKLPDIRQVGRELGVRYVLQGSVRKLGNRIRITYQLSDASSRANISAERFEGGLEELFDLQDRVTSSVVVGTLPSLEQAEIERSRQKPTEKYEAYDYYLRGRASFGKFSPQANAEALGLFNKAIHLDPSFALAFAQAANCYVQRKTWGWSRDLAAESNEAERLVRRAVELDKNDPIVLSIGGWVLAFVVERLEEGAALLDRAVELDTNLYLGWHWKGWASLFLGRDGAIDYFGRALRLSPLHPMHFGPQTGMAWALFFNGDYDEASSWAVKVLNEHALHLPALSVLTASLALAGRIDEARAAYGRIQSQVPFPRISEIRQSVPLTGEGIEKLAKGLRLVGMPE